MAHRSCPLKVFEARSLNIYHFYDQVLTKKAARRAAFLLITKQAKMATPMVLAFEPVVACPPMSLVSSELTMCAELEWIEHVRGV